MRKNRARIISMLLILVIVTGSFSLESKILNKISKYMPDFTEVGLLANVMNIYVQVSGFVRSTNKMVHNIKQAKREWETLTVLVEDLYHDLGDLKDINPYNMDTWAYTLDRANDMLNVSLGSDILYHWGYSEWYLEQGALGYLGELSDLKDYDVRAKRNRDVVVHYYQANQYGKEKQEFQALLKTFSNSTIDIYRKRISELQEKVRKAKTESERAFHEAYLNKNIETLKELESSSAAAFLSDSKEDSLISFSTDLITANLTEIQNTNSILKNMASSASELVAAFHKIKSGNINTLPKAKVPIRKTFMMDVSEYDANDPDKVKAPEAPKEIKAQKTRKKDVSEQDILALQNAADYLSLRQEALIRDINSMRAMTMAFMVAFEGFKQQKQEMDYFRFTHSAMAMKKAL